MSHAVVLGDMAFQDREYGRCISFGMQPTYSVMVVEILHIVHSSLLTPV